MTSTVLTPNCPLCGERPGFVLSDQAFCGNEDCAGLIWRRDMSLDHNLTHATTLDLTVTDQGIGIPAEEIDRIFERFYRVDPARHRSTGGTGLGLSIVKHVAASHGGDVRVWSVEGQGSTFTLTLPRKASNMEATA